MKLAAIPLLLLLLAAGTAWGNKPQQSAPTQPESGKAEETAKIEPRDSTLFGVIRLDFDPLPKNDDKTRYSKLSDEDFRIVADELGVEIAAIKAVVSIEAGSQMKGFWAPGVPVINFDRAMYNRYRNMVADKSGAKGEKVPSGLSGYALQEWTQLINARKVNANGANMGTFWGMFQIGGFNYKICGCSSVNEFVSLMCDSEFAQLNLFAKFISNAGMLNDLKNKNWAGFARKYNGASYARRGYHTKMAAAYKKFKLTSK